MIGPASVGLALLAGAPGLEQVIVIGGGWAPEGNQASIELQAEAVVQALAPTSPTLLFADGGSERRTVQIAKSVSPEAYLLALVFDRTDLLEVDYRPSRLEPDGAARRADLQTALKAAAERSGGLLLVGVGHGSPTDDGSATLDLWNSESLDVAGLADGLERLGPRPIAILLGQCFSGAFAELALQSDRERCVFSAVPGDREAAGCTADVEDPQSRTYVYHFVKALTSREADADGDGTVSLEEAHLQGLVVDDTINVPISASQAWLLNFGKGRSIPGETPLTAIVARARPSERRALSALLPGGVQTKGQVDARWDNMQKRLQTVRTETERRFERREDLRLAVVDRILARWPELANPFHPAARALLGAPAPLLEALKADPDSSALRAAHDAWLKAVQMGANLERSAAKLERWFQVAHAVWHRSRLQQAPKAVRKDYQRLQRCESRSLPALRPQ